MKLKTSIMNGVASFEMADIAKQNALTAELYLELTEGIQAAINNDGVRCILIYGQPDFFSVGNELEGLSNVNYTDKNLPMRVFANTLMQCDKPIVAAVHGLAIGAGCSMLLHCDFVYAADNTKFAFSFVSLGMVPDFAVSYLLAQRVGVARANEMLLLAQPFGAQEAQETGLVNLVLPETEVLIHARHVAERFNKLPPAAVRSTKRLLNFSKKEHIMTAIDEEFSALAQHVKGDELKEMMNAFLEKRWPDFSKF